MPYAPFIVSGTVYDKDTTTAMSSLVVKCVNKTTETAYTSTSTNRVQTTTNSSGQYSIDLANFPGGYTNGDIVEVIVVSSYSKNTVTPFAIDTSVGHEDMDIILHDEVYDYKFKADGIRTITIKHENLTIGTNWQEVILPVNLDDYSDVNLEVNNKSAIALTLQVLTCNNSIAGRPGPGTTSATSFDTKYWVQSGNIENISASTPFNMVWKERPKLTCVRIKAASATNADVSIRLHAAT